jgi:cytochrome c oxidase subunit 2
VVAVFVFYFFYAIVSDFVTPYSEQENTSISRGYVFSGLARKVIAQTNSLSFNMLPYTDAEIASWYTRASIESFFFRNYSSQLSSASDYHFLFYRVTHLPVLEIIWTLIPTVILLFIAVPSFALLYAMDEVIDPRVTVKAIGHQWYWSYEYSDASHDPKKFDSYMVSESALAPGYPRLLSVDNSVVLPSQTHIRVLITSDDVLHSWAVPSLGLKVDAVPGRLSQLALFMRREGVFYGQCSELCGVNHAFMPISVKSVNISEYADWVKSGAGY